MCLTTCIELGCYFQVNHSQRLSLKLLTPWIIANNNGRILAGHCDCMAGLGESCSHVASVFWALESGVHMHQSMTVTQKKAYWVIPGGIKDVPYAPAQQIMFVGKSKIAASSMLACTSNASSAPDVSSITSPFPRPSSSSPHLHYPLKLCPFLQQRI